MNRRSNEVTGMVNFPVNSPDYENTHEGGMFVRVLVLVGDDPFKWMECCGGSQILDYDEILLGGHTEEKLFPNINQKDKKYPNPYRSVECWAILTLGSTGWSGWNDTHSQYWTCSEEDLTIEGRVLLQFLHAQYPSSEIVIATWLDT